jgi:hypothetical protein
MDLDSLIGTSIAIPVLPLILLAAFTLATVGRRISWLSEWVRTAGAGIAIGVFVAVLLIS